MNSKVIFHIEAAYHDRMHKAAHLAIFPLIAEMVTRRGGTVLVQPRPAMPLAADLRWGDGDLHIVQGGFAKGAGWLNTGLAYLTGFWHLDMQGVLADSQLGNLAFDPAQVDGAAAQTFCRDLVARFVVPRRARYKQARAHSDLPTGCIAVFLQGRSTRARDQEYMSDRNMLRAVIAGADGRIVVVKPHPLRHERGSAMLENMRAEGLLFTQTNANVHDILAACCASVSINSAAAIEGFLHGKPAILFGRCDFSGVVETVRQAGDFPAALSRALDQPRDYAPWLYWYFNTGCIGLDAPNAPARIWDIFADAGFDAARLGLRDV